MSKNEYNCKENRREDWETPDWLFNTLDRVFHFGIDLAADFRNFKCNTFIDDRSDFLRVSTQAKVKEIDRWKWCNPPYKPRGCIKWVNPLSRLDKVVVLLPASVGAKWFTSVWGGFDLIIFLDKRLTFKGAPSTAQFDNCIAIRGNNRNLVLSDKETSILRSLGTLVYSNNIITKRVLRNSV